MHAGLRGAQHGVQVEFLFGCFVVEMRAQPRSERRAVQLFEKGAAATRTAAIMQFEITVAGIQRVGHGDHRGDADTAADQDRAAGIARQRKMIARQADLDLATFLQ
ncbi:hypothetical protein D3C73_1462290 [compost metagenome]